ncbi:hypothetical protein [Spiroplasma diminutum]|uniref:Uncharacterized protein n=1 Tax=Spiroplasma diminutum CUAS-1 TaxID=1276221 RepID=S5MIU3_9MOLU|nr:hypothetical protein [Spiroplasma diminutum]AGR41850.1 hypothetical protein SDIMI_v3c01460 [Spiroplasma diminutum CUAS-1]
MKTKDNQKNAIFDLTTTAMIVAFGISLRLIFSSIPGVDLTLIVILITGLYFKASISFISTLGISVLSLLVPTELIFILSSVIIYILLNILIIFLKSLFLKNKSILYILMPVVALMISTLYLIISILVYGKTEGYSLYLLKLHQAYIIFFVYCVITYLFLKQIENILIKMEDRYPTIFNNKFKSYIESKEEYMIKVSDKKSNYNIQLASMIISMMLLTIYFAFVPYKMITFFNDINYLAAIIIVPILMLFITPTWMKLAKKIGNFKVLKLNSIGLLFAIIFTFSSFATTKYSLSLGLIFSGLILFGIFIAGFLPINIELIKSYEKRNNLKNKTSKYNSIFAFLLLPIPFTLDYFTKSTYVLLFLMAVVIIIICLLFFNKNIMSERNVLNINRDSFKTLKKNKKFFAEVFVQNYFIGFFKFLDWSLVLFYFIVFNKNQINISSQVENGYVVLFLVIGFLLKYIAQAIFSNLKFKNNNLNRIAMTTTIISVLLFVVFLSLCYTLNFENKTNIYYLLLTILMFIFGSSYSLIEKTKAKRFRLIVSEEEFSLAMIIDHVMGNAFFSLIIAIIFFATILLAKVTLLSLIILMSIFVFIALILLIINISLKNKYKKEN